MSKRGAWLVAALLAFGVVALASPAPADERYTPPDRPGPPLQVDADARSASLHCPAPLTGLQNDPVLLIAGTTLDPESNFSWNYVPAFEAAGRAWCSVALPDNGMGDIQLAAEHVVHALRTMAAEAGRRVDIVGFSQGGMIGRWALRFWPDTRDLVDDLVGMAPSNHGTDTAVATCQPACARSYQQQRSDAAFIEALNSYQETFAGISYTVVYTWADQVVAPNVGPDARSPLRDAHGPVTNVAVQDICPGHVADHFAIGSTDPVAYAVVTDALDNDGPADPTRIDPTVCGQPAMPGVDLATFPEGAARMLQTVEHHNRTAERVPEEPPLQCYVLAACVASSADADEPSADPTPAAEPLPAQSLPATGGGLAGLLAGAAALAVGGRLRPALSRSRCAASGTGS